MAITKRLREIMLHEFGYSDWKILRANIAEAMEPYPVTVDWECMAKGRKLEGRVCAFADRIRRNTGVDACFVSDNHTWIRFKGSPTIWKYRNSNEMREQIRFLDLHGLYDDMEDGDEFVLEPIGTNKARSTDYRNARRKAIKAGKHVVTPRGKNVNMRRDNQYHFRPY